MTETWDVLTSSSLGTSTTRTQINGASDYFIPAQISQLIGVEWAQAETGAYTAGESIQTVTELTSQDITPNIAPKRVALPGIIGGLGTAGNGQIPALEEIPYNIMVRPSNRLQGWGTELTANTVAPRLGASLHLTDTPNGKPHVFWDVADSSGTPTATALGTAAATVNGTNITLTGARALLRAYSRIYPTTVTASVDYLVYSTITCSNFNNAAPLKYYNTPIASHLGTAIGVTIPADSENPIMRQFNTQAQVVVQNQYTVDIAITGNGKAITGVAFLR
jgi:hypothetical protein